ncbi:MAG TPA: histidine kinase dimerization/phospho-acceptor domain-containing protein, partial [Polyangiaceae bacterium]|nr:histidine kinase dimerization/phospho-acceptor domain-containing protein [Polyangiaceae bacterium]
MERGTARLLAVCSIGIAAIFGALHTVNEPTVGLPVVGAVTYGCVLTSYVLSRTRFYRAGSVVLSVLFPSIALTEAVYAGQVASSSMFHAALAPFIAGMFLGVRAAAYCAAAIFVVVMGLLSFLQEQFSLAKSVELATSCLFSSLLAVTYAVHRDWLDDKRRGGNQLQEAQLLQMQKMEAVGRLAGGIAHDFNNLLTVIAGGVELLGRRSAQKELRLIESATNSARALTSQLLTLSRQSVVQNASCDLGANLAQM